MLLVINICRMDYNGTKHNNTECVQVSSGFSPVVVALGLVACSMLCHSSGTTTAGR